MSGLFSFMFEPVWYFFVITCLVFLFYMCNYVWSIRFLYVLPGSLDPGAKAIYKFLTAALN